MGFCAFFISVVAIKLLVSSTWLGVFHGHRDASPQWLHTVLLYPEQGCWFSVVAVAALLCPRALVWLCARSVPQCVPDAQCCLSTAPWFFTTGVRLWRNKLVLEYFHTEMLNEKKNRVSAIPHAAVYLARPFSGSSRGEFGTNLPCLSSASGCGPGAPTWRPPRGAHRPLPGT